MEDISEGGNGGGIHLKGIHVAIGRRYIKLNKLFAAIPKRFTESMKGTIGCYRMTTNQFGQIWCGQGFVYQDTHSLLGFLCTKGSLFSAGLDSIWSYLQLALSVNNILKHRITSFLNVPLQRSCGISSALNGG